MGFGKHVAELCGTAVVVVIGVLWNIFNLVVTVAHQLKSRDFQTVGLIILCISVSNVLLELSMFAIVASTWAGMFCLPEIHPLLKVALGVWIGSSCTSFWSIAWLSVFYCTKVVRVSGDLLVKLKRNISPLINAALLLTALCSSVMAVPFLLLRSPPFNRTTAEETRNTTCIFRSPRFPPWINSNLYILSLVCLLCPIPLLVMIPTSLRLVVHLCHHTLTMWRNKTDIQSTSSYLLVCKLTVSLVAVYLKTLAIVSLFFIDQISTRSLGFDIIALGCSFYCTATGALLTVSNKYLKEKLWALFCWRKPSKTVSSTQSGDTGVA